MEQKTINNKGMIHYGYIIVFCCCLIMGANVGLVMSCAGIYHSVYNKSGYRTSIARLP